MTRLILIRHGETDYNAQKRYCGFSDPALNKKGIAQLEKLTAELKGVKVDKVYSSDLKRAYASAAIIFKDRPVQKMSKLREMNFGIFEGLRYEELLRKYPKLYRKWIDNPLKIRIPEGEGLTDLSRRVKKSLDFMLTRHAGETVAVVTHAGPIRVILCGVLNKDLKDFWQMEPRNLATYAVARPSSSASFRALLRSISE